MCDRGVNVMVYSEGVDQVVEKHGLQKITLLREVSIKTGIQVPLIPRVAKYTLPAPPSRSASPTNPRVFNLST